MKEEKVLSGYSRIKVISMMAQRSALRLECLGMTRHGRSVYSIIKETYNLKGSKKSVLEQFSAIVDKAKQEVLGE